MPKKEADHSVKETQGFEIVEVPANDAHGGGWGVYSTETAGPITVKNYLMTCETYAEALDCLRKEGANIA